MGGFSTALLKSVEINRNGHRTAFKFAFPGVRDQVRTFAIEQCGTKPTTFPMLYQLRPFPVLYAPTTALRIPSFLARSIQCLK